MGWLVGWLGWLVGGVGVGGGRGWGIGGGADQVSPIEAQQRHVLYPSPPSPHHPFFPLESTTPHLCGERVGGRGGGGWGGGGGFQGEFYLLIEN